MEFWRLYLFWVINNPPLNEEFVIDENGIIRYVEPYCYSCNVVKWN